MTNANNFSSDRYTGNLPKYEFPLRSISAFDQFLTRQFSLPALTKSESSPSPNYIFTRYTQGQRGTIFDARGVTLAVTKPVWEYRLDSLEATKDPVNPRKPITPQRRMEKIKTVATCLNLPLVSVMDAYARPNRRYQYLATSDDQEAHDTLANPANHFRELAILEKQVRVYPQGRLLSQTLGFVSKDPAHAVGGAGLELRYEKYLKGTPGQVHGAKDAIGREERSRESGPNMPSFRTAHAVIVFITLPGS